jgi:predicted dehydrogenase
MKKIRSAILGYLAANAIGRVFMIRRVQASFATRCDWQTERRYGGGYLLNWGPHIVDPPIVLMNRRVVSVFGRFGRIINPGDVEDAFLAVLTRVFDAIRRSSDENRLITL